MYYAVKARDDEVRSQSSSGGVFLLLAKYVLKNNGIVYGAIYNENFEVIHNRSESIEEVLKMCGSKYSKSNVSGCLKTLKNDLESERIVMFSGTPCQISMVKNLYKNYSNLITVDLVCHGTPSQNYLKDYVKYEEKKYKSKLVKINMRYKKNYFKSLNKRKYSSIIAPKYMYLEFENGKKLIEKSDFNIYYQLFDYFVNKGCFKCPFAKLKRNSDITIGDFHEFNTKLDAFNDYNGVSLVLVNSKLGENVFDKLKNEIFYEEMKEFDIYQPALYQPATKPEKYEQFQETYLNKGFDVAINEYKCKGLKYNLKKCVNNIGMYELLKSLRLGGFKVNN